MFFFQQYEVQEPRMAIIVNKARLYDSCIAQPAAPPEKPETQSEHLRQSANASCGVAFQ